MTPGISQQERRADVLCLKDGIDNILREHHANVEHGDEKTRYGVSCASSKNDIKDAVMHTFIASVAAYL